LNLAQDLKSIENLKRRIGDNKMAVAANEIHFSEPLKTVKSRTPTAE
jgi:hypothetical protein